MSYHHLAARVSGELAASRFKRIAIASVAAREAAIGCDVTNRNSPAVPFMWTATVKSVQARVRNANETLVSLHQIRARTAKPPPDVAE